MAFEQSDYIPSTIPQTTVQAARDEYLQGDYAGAWQILADAGDRYADNAAGVIGGGDACSRLASTGLLNSLASLRASLPLRLIPNANL